MWEPLEAITRSIQERNHFDASSILSLSILRVSQVMEAFSEATDVWGRALPLFCKVLQM